MSRDHFGFALFLVALLIAPQLPLDIQGVSADITLSLGFLGLLVWALLSPVHLVRIRCSGALVMPLALLAFAFYAFGVTLVQGTFLQVAYASQYLFYLLLGFLLLSGYFSRAIRFEQVDVSLRILRAVGLVFALGVIVSAWAGPLYQLGDLVGGFERQRALGFVGNPNSAGPVLLVFLALVFFVPPTRRRGIHWVLLGTILVALILTTSRGANIAILLSLILLTFAQGAKLMVTRRISGRLIAGSWLALWLGTLVATIFILAPGNTELPLITTVKDAFGLSEGNALGPDFATRTNYWQKGLNTWNDASPLEVVFGQGFRGSQTVAAGVWVTPHNAYVAMLGDFGLVGLLLFLLPMIGLSIISALRIMTVRRSTIESFAFASLSGLLFHNMTGTFFYSPIIISLTLVVLIFSSLSFLHQESRPRRAPERVHRTSTSSAVPCRP